MHVILSAVISQAQLYSSRLLYDVLGYVILYTCLALILGSTFASRSNSETVCDAVLQVMDQRF